MQDIIIADQQYSRNLVCVLLQYYSKTSYFLEYYKTVLYTKEVKYCQLKQSVSAETFKTSVGANTEF